MFTDLGGMTLVVKRKKGRKCTVGIARLVSHRGDKWSRVTFFYSSCKVAPLKNAQRSSRNALAFEHAKGKLQEQEEDGYLPFN